jgi:protein-tyrosine-phosphatase
MTKEKVLFVCIHNSARSQMAEGIARLVSDLAEIKALWNATKKPTEFATLLMAKIKEKNDVR